MNTEKDPEDLTPGRLTMSEVAHLYKRHRTTILRELQPIMHELGERIGHTWSKEQVAKIFKFLGSPALFVTAYKRLDSWMDAIIFKRDLTEKYFHHLNANDPFSQDIDTDGLAYKTHASDGTILRLSEMQKFFTAQSDLIEIPVEEAITISGGGTTGTGHLLTEITEEILS